MSTITKIEHMEEKIQPIFKKMFDMVGAPYDLELVDDWYCKYEWTKEQEEEFKDWFVQYHWKGEGRLGRGVLSRSARTKKLCLDGWRYFNLMWGWKWKE